MIFRTKISQLFGLLIVFISFNVVLVNSSTAPLAQNLSQVLSNVNPLHYFDPFHILRGLSIVSQEELVIEDKGLLDLDALAPIDSILHNDMLELSKKHPELVNGLMAELGYNFDNKDIEHPIILANLLASITPLLGVGETCRQQSLTYIYGLVAAPAEVIWPHLMLDATGKKPSGIISDVINLCEVLDYYSHQQCTKFPILGKILEQIVIPKGNIKAMGHFQGCLTTVATSVDEELPFESFSGQHCTFQLVGGGNNRTISKSRWLEDALPTPNQVQFGEQSRIPLLPPIFDGLDLVPDIAALQQVYLAIATARWGACIPSGCTMEEAETNYNILYEPYNIMAAPIGCETEETQAEFSEFDAASYIAFIVFCTIGAAMLIGTLIEIYQQFAPQYTDMTLAEISATESMAFKVLKCFTVYTNGKKILSSKKTAGNTHLGCLSGMRVISMLWVVLGHSFLANLAFGQLQNPKYAVDRYIGRDVNASWEVVTNALPSVDSFFFMSGLLVAYLSFMEMEKKRFNLALFYIHRYIRLTIPVALVILFSVGFEYQMGSGYMWPFMGVMVDNCKNYWWSNLLYVNNFISSEKQCLSQSWYLACDMQFFWYSPLLLIPMFKYQKGGNWGLKWWFLNLVVYTIIPIALTVQYNLPPTNIIVNENVDQNGFDMSGQMYVRPYTRFQPYLIGIGLGYLLFKLKDKEVKMHWTTNVLGWICAIATGIAVVYGLYAIRSTNKLHVNSYSIFEAAMYNGFHRIAWSMALGWVVFACAKGYGGIINSFLSWGMFLSLARMSYMVYLIHLDMLTGIFVSFPYTIIATPVTMATFYVAAVFIAFGISFVATLTMEAPFINLEKLLLGRLLGRGGRESNNDNLKSERKEKFESSNETPSTVDVDYVEEFKETFPEQEKPSMKNGSVDVI